MARKVSEVNKKRTSTAKKPVKKATGRQVIPATYKREIYSRNSGISAIVSFCVGLIFCLSMWTPFVGSFGSWLRSGFLFLLGTPSYFYPILLLALGFLISKTRKMGMFGSKYWILFVLLSMISAFWHTCTWGIYGMYGVLEIATAYGGAGGGFLGACLAKPIVAFMSPIGGGIIIFALTAILFTITYNINWVELADRIIDFFEAKREEYDNKYVEEDIVDSMIPRLCISPSETNPNNPKSLPPLLIFIPFIT